MAMRAWTGFLFLITCTFLGGLAVAANQDQAPTGGKDPLAWPRDIKSGSNTITVHQPQLYSWDGNLMKAQSAVAIKPSGSDEQIFGVAMLTARTLIDKEAHVVTFDPIDVLEVKFPSAPDQDAALLPVLKQAVAGKVKTMDLDRFEALLAVVREQRKTEQQLLLHGVLLLVRLVAEWRDGRRSGRRLSSAASREGDGEEARP